LHEKRPGFIGARVVKFERKVRRAQVRRAALADAVGRGCTCSRPKVELLRVGAVSRVAIEHDEGCPAAGRESVLLLPKEAER
jgi:hypothetical protein